MPHGFGQIIVFITYLPLSMAESFVWTEDREMPMFSREAYTSSSEVNQLFRSTSTNNPSKVCYDYTLPVCYNKALSTHGRFSRTFLRYYHSSPYMLPCSLFLSNEPTLIPFCVSLRRFGIAVLINGSFVHFVVVE